MPVYLAVGFAVLWTLLQLDHQVNCGLNTLKRDHPGFTKPDMKLEADLKKMAEAQANNLVALAFVKQQAKEFHDKALAALRSKDNTALLEAISAEVAKGYTKMDAHEQLFLTESIAEYAVALATLTRGNAIADPVKKQVYVDLANEDIAELTRNWVADITTDQHQTWVMQ